MAGLSADHPPLPYARMNGVSIASFSKVIDNGYCKELYSLT